MNGTSTLSISALRQRTAQAIASVVQKQEPAVILQRSRPTAVLVDVNYFRALEDAVLDLTDAQEAELAKKEGRRPFADYLKKRWGQTTI